jgi:hypothetical protein
MWRGSLQPAMKVYHSSTLPCTLPVMSRELSQLLSVPLPTARAEPINRSATVKQKVIFNTRRTVSRQDFGAVATFTAADRELWIARFVVTVSVLPETTIVPKLPTRRISTGSIGSANSISPQHRHSQSGTTGVLHNSTLSGRMGIHRTASSCVTTVSRRAFSASCRVVATCNRRSGNSSG